MRQSPPEQPDPPAANLGITNLFETHLTVTNLDRSIAFYRDTLGLPFASRIDARRVAFFWIGAPGRAMLGLWESNDVLRLRLHCAFSVSVADLLAAPAKLRQAGVPTRGFAGEPNGEPYVIAWMPALALYFNDPDDHSLELLAMLDQPPRPDLGLKSWPEWQALTGAPAPT